MGLVTAVLCAAFDEGTDVEILRVREAVRAAGIVLPPRPPHRPHISMVAARVTAGPELERLLALTAEVAARHEPFPLELGEVGRFGRAGALWLGPAPARQLAALHRDAVACLVDAGWVSAFGQRSEPDSWVPHCTLATHVPKPQLRHVQAAVQASYRPISARVDAVATILVGGRGDVGLIRLGSAGATLTP